METRKLVRTVTKYRAQFTRKEMDKKGKIVDKVIGSIDIDDFKATNKLPLHTIAFRQCPFSTVDQVRLYKMGQYTVIKSVRA